MYRSGLAQRDLRLLLGAMFVSFAGSWAYSVALLAVVFERTESLAWVGAATVGRFVPQLLLSPSRDGGGRPAGAPQGGGGAPA